MALLPSLPTEAALTDVVAAFEEPMLHLKPFAQSLMRGPSPLSEGERELIAAYVSGLNACQYCHGIHAQTAFAFGISEHVFEGLMADIAAAEVSDKLKPILRYVKKLTETPSRMVQADAQAVFDAGWDETALFHAVAVCAYFNMMNRIVEGAGVAVPSDDYAARGARLAEQGYSAGKRR